MIPNGILVIWFWGALIPAGFDQRKLLTPVLSAKPGKPKRKASKVQAELGPLWLCRVCVSAFGLVCASMTSALLVNEKMRSRIEMTHELQL
jgi:hypothetical protein